jgi:transposase
VAQWGRRAGCRVGAAPDTGSAPHSASDPAAEISRLRRENDRLRTERDILKKAVATFSELLKLQQPVTV